MKEQITNNTSLMTLVKIFMFALCMIIPPVAKSRDIIEEILNKVTIIMAEPAVQKGKLLSEFVDEIIALINKDPRVVQEWLNRYNLNLEDFVAALRDAKKAKNVFGVQKAFNKFWPAVPQEIKQVGLIKIALNVNTRLPK